MRNPDFVAVELGDKPARPTTFDITRDETAFRRLVRADILRFLQAVVARDWEEAVESIENAAEAEAPAPGDDPEIRRRREARRVELAFLPYLDTHGRFRLDPEGRSAKHTHFAAVEHLNAVAELEVTQVLVDHDSLNDHEVVFRLDLAASRLRSEIVLGFVEVRRFA